jgi:hypothetical protein
VSRLTKQIRLVLISSSLALGGCGRGEQAGVDCQRQPPGDGKQMPPVCGPVDGNRGTSGHGYHSGYWGSSWFGHGGTWGGSAGHAGSVSARGGFGSSGHGVAS